MVFISFGTLFFIYDHFIYYFMAPELVSKNLTATGVNVLLYRLAVSRTIFSGRTLLQHIEAVDKLSIKIVLTLSC